MQARPTKPLPLADAGVSNAPSVSQLSSVMNVSSTAESYTPALTGELRALPSVPQHELLSFGQVVQLANVSGQTPEQRTRNMQAIFNRNRPELFMVESRMIGHRVEPGMVRLIHLNNVPEMVTCYDGPREFRPGKGLDVRDELGNFPESKLFFGAKGVFVVNVPQGKYVLAWVGTEPLILDQGTHVILSPMLQNITEQNLVDQSDLFIHHGNVYIIRVPPGRVACITLNNEPYILESRREPYVFRSALFSFNPEQGYVDAAASYIRNGSLHVLQVPKGKIATVWVGAKPALLLYREKPYIIYDNLFRLQPKNGQEELFFGANEEIIRHGSIKRIITRTGHVAVIYDSGHLQVLKPNEDGRPVIIDSESVTVGEMFNIQKQTLRFPSEKIKREREREYQGEDRKAINYEVFTTANGARYGVKLLVVFSVCDPHLALTNFKPDDIVPHIENLVVTEMNKAIQATESTSFLQTKARAQAAPRPSTDPNVPSAPVFYASAQDEIKDHLCRDLRDVGIDIDRVSIEESIPIDKAVIEQMAQFAVRNKKITLEVALLERESQIAEQQARQAAMKATILRQMEYDMRIRSAQVDFECAQLRAEAFKLLTQARAKQMQSMGHIIEKSPSLQQLHVASAVYGNESILPHVNSQYLSNNSGFGRTGDFFASSYLPNPDSLGVLHGVEPAMTQTKRVPDQNK